MKAVYKGKQIDVIPLIAVNLKMQNLMNLPMPYGEKIMARDFRALDGLYWPALLSKIILSFIDIPSTEFIFIIIYHAS